ncbi:MAG: hypothetical protein JNK55_23335 [Rubrivivax sp.]|nr:hypothetical protein [Rubrivivax sp.]
MIARTPKSSKSAKTGRSRQSVTGKPTTEPRLSRQRKPAQMPAADWQRTLRWQFARDQGFELVNLSRDKPAPIFSDYSVFNPGSGGRYRVSIRGTAAGDNLCTCLDYATNELGTCKHIEIALVRLMARRGAKAALQRGYAPVFSEVYLHQAGQRTVRFRAGSECPVALLKRTGQLFDAAASWILPWARLGDLDAFIAAAQRDSFSAGHELRIDERALGFVAQVRDGQRRQRLLAVAYPKGAADQGLAKLLKARLYRYQAEGTLFAARAGPPAVPVHGCRRAGWWRRRGADERQTPGEVHAECG